MKADTIELFPDGSKQQSIEEAAKKYSGIAYNREDYEEKYYNAQGCDKYDAFIAGAKWMETLAQAYGDYREREKGAVALMTFNKWYEQFK